MHPVPLWLILGNLAWIAILLLDTQAYRGSGSASVAGPVCPPVPNTIGVAPGWYQGPDGRCYWWPGN